MKLPVATLLMLACVAGSAAAQQPAAPSRNSAQIQGEGGPVTVTWGQSDTVPNAADYRVKVADLDSNGDGVLVRSEVPDTHALSSEFSRVDRNRDGRITQAELDNWK